MILCLHAYWCWGFVAAGAALPRWSVSYVSDFVSCINLSGLLCAPEEAVVVRKHSRAEL